MLVTNAVCGQAQCCMRHLFQAGGGCTPHAGLQLAPGAGQTTRTWIVYNKPKVASYTHAGMLMGLGLTGAARCS